MPGAHLQNIEDSTLCIAERVVPILKYLYMHISGAYTQDEAPSVL